MSAGPGPERLSGRCLQIALPDTIAILTDADLAPGGLTRRVAYFRQKRIEAITEWLATTYHLPPVSKAVLLGIVHRPGSRRFDPGQWEPTVHAAAAGLIKAGVLPGTAAVTRTELRGASGRRSFVPQFVLRVYADGAEPPPPLSRHTQGRLENYLWVGGEDPDPATGQRPPARETAARLGVQPRTVVRWRGLLRVMGDAPWTFTAPGRGDHDYGRGPRDDDTDD
jgi:hypothetical protein